MYPRICQIESGLYFPILQIEWMEHIPSDNLLDKLVQVIFVVSDILWRMEDVFQKPQPMDKQVPIDIHHRLYSKGKIKP